MIKRLVGLMVLVFLVLGFSGISGAFPTVQATNGGTNNGTSHTVNLPSGITSGDLLLVFFAADGEPTITFPEGWTQLFQQSYSHYVKLGIWYRVADGTEGATIIATTSTTEQAAHTSYRITGYSGTPEVGTAVTGGTNHPNPPSLTPSWGAEDTLWFAVMAIDAFKNVTAYPTDYTDGRNDWINDTYGCSLGTARRELNAVSEDPGAFTTITGDQWISNTLAIQPIGGITVSGTIYTNEGKSANVGAGVDVSLSVNGAAKSTVQTTAGGAFSFSSVSTDFNETLTVFIDDDLNYEANLITQAASSDADITGLEVYTDKIILRHETAGPMTNALLVIADGSGDDDIHYSMTGNNVDFDDNFELWIDNAKAYTPGGNIEADDLELSGTASLIPEANLVDIHGSFVISAAGAFTKGASTITFSGAGDQLFTTNSQAFHNLTINNTGDAGSNDITVNNNLDIDGKLTITDGNLDCTTNNPNLFISGDFEIEANGTFTKGSGTTTFNGTTTFTDNTTPKQNLGIVVVD